MLEVKGSLSPIGAVVSGGSAINPLHTSVGSGDGSAVSDSD